MTWISREVEVGNPRVSRLYRERDVLAIAPGFR